MSALYVPTSPSPFNVCHNPTLNSWYKILTLKFIFYLHLSLDFIYNTNHPPPTCQLVSGKSQPFAYPPHPPKFAYFINERPLLSVITNLIPTKIVCLGNANSLPVHLPLGKTSCCLAIIWMHFLIKAIKFQAFYKTNCIGCILY